MSYYISPGGVGGQNSLQTEQVGAGGAKAGVEVVWKWEPFRHTNR